MSKFYADADDCVLFGCEAAMVLHNIGFWCANNLANRKNIHDRRVWTYNTREALLEQFPFIAPESSQKARLMKMGRILKLLEEKGAIVATNELNKNSYDRTKWYAIADPKKLKKYAPVSPKALKTLREQKCSLEETEVFPREPEKCSLSTDINTDAKQVSESVTSNARENLSDRVITELLTDQLPPKHERYARLKISEFQERWPNSESVADCWSYVATAVNHKIDLLKI